ncbi:GNAT family N-acetyltransferase [Anaerobacillus alkaliphilus]|uniref:GNAT family N-acetyltransferase n=1 Tax=Anaerobacillus alkaliphilus TaxID=1548597 RepID=A0A4Q0VKI2_9BACI|nr:GNAT family N-acetyltransferase [Anaerobacillus alkaliphilus]RXI95514.1 GNAT family N-acetyltransferase [Anaerobacillus alkaliphilus]
MDKQIRIEQIFSEVHFNELAELLAIVVEDGASIGFLPPLSNTDAIDYWKTVLGPGVVLLVAKLNEQIVGSVQLHLSMKQNGRHRAEVAKLMTHPNFRRNGIGRILMEKAEQIAKQEQRSLIVLDTREGDPSNNLYHSLGYIEGGRIPNYAMSADGTLAATILYYKNVD